MYHVVSGAFEVVSGSFHGVLVGSRRSEGVSGDLRGYRFRESVSEAFQRGPWSFRGLTKT